MNKGECGIINENDIKVHLTGLFENYITNLAHISIFNRMF